MTLAGPQKNHTTLAGHDITLQFDEHGNVRDGQVVDSEGRIHGLTSDAASHFEIGYMAESLAGRAQKDAQDKAQYLSQYGTIEDLRTNAGFKPHIDEFDRYSTLAAQMTERADNSYRAAARTVDRSLRNTQAMAWLGGELSGIEIEVARVKAANSGVQLAELTPPAAPATRPAQGTPDRSRSGNGIV